MASLIYGVIATALGAVFVALAWRVWRMADDDTFMRPARQLFTFSLLYLFLLFVVLLAERGAA
jgi:protoheme IX farnesyltransferase